MGISHFTFLLVLLTIFGCGNLNDQNANKQKLAEGLKDQQVKRVTDDQLLVAAYQQGSNIVEQIEKRAKPISFWFTSAGHSLLDSMNSGFAHGGIKLILRDSPSTELSNEEKAILEAYQYSSEQHQPLHENVQSLTNEHLLYTFPLEVDSTFMGMWSLTLSKKTVIRSL